MKPGDLISLSEGRLLYPVSMPRARWGAGTFRVPSNSIALVLRIEARPTYSDHENCRVHVLVNGRLGWVYPVDGEVINT